MKQILQNLRTGATEVVDIPAPTAGPGHVLLRTSRTLISAGTERMLVAFGKAGPIDKARQQPEKVRQVLDKIKTDGLLPTLDAVRHKLDQPLPLGYCHVGRVEALGAGVQGLAPGQRVASNGRHAELVSVPANLCAAVPETVSDEDAAFTVIGAIALQGIRLVQPTLGEAVVVTGLGLVGLLAVQLLRAHGCRVLGIDRDPARLALARQFGADVVDLSAGADPVQAALRFSRGRGVDAVVIAAATSSSEPVHHAAAMCRVRGRIVLVGVTGLELARDEFFKKEISFQVSCSYGPGRYDPAYEEQGHDYPFGFVRWTEQRNFEAVLDMMADGRINVGPLITHRFAIEDAASAYALVTGSAPSLGILLEYAEASPTAGAPHTVVLDPRRAPTDHAPTGLACVGAGNYATAVLFPAFKAAGADLRVVVSAGGVTAAHAARRFGFAAATTRTADALAQSDVGAVVITTRHDSHARLVIQALEAGHHVFVEKPLCLTLDELAAIRAAYDARVRSGRPPVLAVGFNRRYAPHTLRMQQLLAATPGPKCLVMTVNAGAIPPHHWTQDPAVGGGRLIGEACHFLDLLQCLVGERVTHADVMALSPRPRDTFAISLAFADGSLGTIHYVATGSKAFPKERLEVFAGGRVLQLDNFRVLRGFGWPGFSRLRLWRQDKGQHACAAAFLRAVGGAHEAVPAFDHVEATSRLAIELAAGV